MKRIRENIGVIVREGSIFVLRDVKNPYFVSDTYQKLGEEVKKYCLDENLNNCKFGVEIMELFYDENMENEVSFSMKRVC